MVTSINPLKHHFLKKNFTAIFMVLTSFGCINAQNESDSLTRRKIFVGSAMTTVGVGSLFLLNQLWYVQYERSPFHIINDNNGWLQMDKAGHAFSTYTIGRYSYESLKWSGISENRSIWIGGTSGLLYLTGIELMDGKSTGWGFSYGDMIANTSGCFAFIAQQKIWNEQRITLKFSYSPTDFSMLNPEQLGHNFQQRIFKDYNGQTYWSSINIHSFLASDARFPRCINLAFGIGATKMLSANTSVYSVNNFQREREFYISFDADLDRVQWKKKWMKSIAKILSFIKIPGPTLEVQSDGDVKMHLMFF